MQKRITKNLTLKILAFLIAVFLWLIVVNIDDPVDDKTFSNIPVQVTHEAVSYTHLTLPTTERV